MPKSRTIAVPIPILSRLIASSSLRSVKAMLIPYTQIWWGSQDDFLYSGRCAPEISINIAWFSQIMGLSISSRITTEIRKIYRKMNQDIFPEEESSSIIFSYCGTSKDKRQFLLKVHRPELLYNLGQHGSFVCMSSDDVFRCQSVYDFRVLSMVASFPSEHTGYFTTKTIKINTYLLKNNFFAMGLFQGCHVDKKHPKYDKLMLDTVEYYYNALGDGELSYDDCRNALNLFAQYNDYKNYDGLMSVLGEVVTFNKRSRIDEYLQHGLEIITQGKMFEIYRNKNGKLFKKVRKAGYRIDFYEITVTQHYKI